MLPKVIAESQVEPFKFWFNNSLQDGVHFQNELYFRLKESPISERGHLYQLACKLAQRGGDVFITVSRGQCRLWANLRNQKMVVQSVASRLALPTVDSLMQ
ncbi:MAG: hypothetical protein ACFBSG_04185 [Leptolyngbyaceae cyanobacterium]